MSVILVSGNEMDGEDGGLKGNVRGQSLGPAVLVPTQVFEKVVTRTKNILASHREWLNILPERDEKEVQNKVRDVPATLITPPPSLNRRLAASQVLSNGVLPECSGFVASAAASGSNAGAASASSVFSISLSSISSTASASIASLQTSLTSASSALASASIALASANANASAATAAQISIQSSASSAISSASLSASLAIASANAAANQAQAAQTLAIAQAQASVSGISQQATANIRASQVAAMNKTTLALVITFSIIGSSLLTMLVIYLILRYRQKRRREREEAYLREVDVKHESEESRGLSLSAFPMPGGREGKTWSSVVREGRPGSEVEAERERRTWGVGNEGNSRRVQEFPLNGRKTWSSERRMTDAGAGERPQLGRKNTLTYDANYPDQPPRFGSWLGELGKGEEVKGKRGKKADRKVSRESEEGSEIGTAV